MTIQTKGKAAAGTVAGDNGAFRELYDRYAPRGFVYAESLLHNRSDSEEALQEAFCRILGPIERGTIDPARGGFRALFFATIRNLCIDVLRKRKRPAPISLEAVAERSCAVGRMEGCEEARSFEETQARVRAAIAALPPRQSRALSLRLKSRMSYAEIATRLKCTRDQVRTWIYRARRTLEKRFVADGLLRPPAGKERHRS
jgi:RNA polymerase sigma-70 factor, ECF subfamily